MKKLFSVLAISAFGLAIGCNEPVQSTKELGKGPVGAPTKVGSDKHPDAMGGKTDAPPTAKSTDKPPAEKPPADAPPAEKK